MAKADWVEYVLFSYDIKKQPVNQSSLRFPAKQIMLGVNPDETLLSGRRFFHRTTCGYVSIIPIIAELVWDFFNGRLSFLSWSLPVLPTIFLLRTIAFRLSGRATTVCCVLVCIAQTGCTARAVFTSALRLV